MPQRISPAKIRTQTITQDGEVHLLITLDINLNLNSDGINVSVKSGNSVTEEIVDDNKIHYPIPDFSSSSGLNFGKNLT